MIALVKKYPLTALTLMVSVFLFLRLGSWGVTETSEARYAEISWEMMKTGDITHPRLLGIGHYHKPPLTYALTALSYHIWGVGNFATRFFLQIAILLQLVLIYAIGRQMFHHKTTALYAAALYISFPAVIISCRGLTTDAFLTTFILSSIYTWMVYRQQGRILFLYAFYIFLALGFLTKGPLILIVPLLVMVAFNYHQEPIKTKSVHRFLAPATGILIGCSWYVALILEDPYFLKYFLLDHTVQRFFDPEAFRRSEPFWYYLAFVPITTFPWFLMMLKRFYHKRKEMKQSKVLATLFLWIFPPLLFFSISSSKLILYVLPIYPGIALACAYFLINSPVNQLRIWNLLQLFFQVLVLVALTYSFLKSYLMYNGIALALIAAALLGLTIIQSIKSIDIRSKLVSSAVFFIVLLTTITTFIFSSNPGAINSSTPLVNFIRDNDLKDHTIMVYNNRLPSLAFHLQKQIVSLYDGHYSLNRETWFEKDDEWSKNLLNLTSKKDQQRLRGYVNGNCVLIVKDGIPQQRKWLTDSFDHHISLDKWTIYFDQAHRQSRSKSFK